MRRNPLDYPRYFQTLEASRIVAADDVAKDVRTLELAANYLTAAGITSLLHVPIWIRGTLVGVICLEHPYLESYAYGIRVIEKDGETLNSHNGRIEGFASSKSYLVNEDVLVILLSNVGYAALEQLEQKLIEMARS